MRKTILIKGLFVTICLLGFLPFSSNAQCYGPTATGVTANGYTKQPTTNGNYFVNHQFSTFTDTANGALNGNAITMTSTIGTPSNNTITNTLASGESLVTGS